MKTLSRFHWWIERLFLKVLKGFPGGSDGKKKICLQCKRPGFNPWVEKIPWRRNSNPLQSSCLENPQRQRSLRGCSPRGHKELDTTEQLSVRAHTHTHTHTGVARNKRCSLITGLGRSPEKEMATHSSILAREISWTEGPGGLQSMESQKSETRLRD